MDAKVNTIVKRFHYLKKRYNINIHTTATGYYPSKKEAASKVVKSPRGRPAKKEAGRKLSSRKAAVKNEDDGSYNPKVQVVVKARQSNSSPDASAWNRDDSASE